MFGAGSGGAVFLKNIRDGEFNVEIVAVADNNKTKQGRKFHGLTVIEPKKIRELEYDAIVITSIFVNQIREQLIKELKVDEKKIEVPLKELMKTSYMSKPFEDPVTRETARKTLFYILGIFESNNITYFINHGTLLGIVRDDDIIPWDDDIDITIYEQDMKNALSYLKRSFQNLDYKTEQVQYSGTAIYQNNKTLTAINISAKRIVDGMTVHEFSIDVQPVTFEKDMAIMPNTYAPAYHFTKTETIEFKGRSVTVPFEYKKYLEFSYGDWNVPKKNMTCMDIMNLKKGRTTDLYSAIPIF